MCGVCEQFRKHGSPLQNYTTTPLCHAECYRCKQKRHLLNISGQRNTVCGWNNVKQKRQITRRTCCMFLILWRYLAAKKLIAQQCIGRRSNSRVTTSRSPWLHAWLRCSLGHGGVQGQGELDRTVPPGIISKEFTNLVYVRIFLVGGTGGGFTGGAWMGWRVGRMGAGGLSKSEYAPQRPLMVIMYMLARTSHSLLHPIEWRNGKHD